jgi:exosortase B
VVLLATQPSRVEQQQTPTHTSDVSACVVAGLGLAALFGPTYWSAAHGIWQTDDMGHGPIVLVVSAWLFWSVRRALVNSPRRASTWASWILLGLGLVMYIVGRVVSIASVEFAAQLPVVAALVLLLRGPHALRAAWFAIFFLMFTVPMPGTLVDAVTSPLKQWISAIVVEVLHAIGYPIGRSGVVITVGQYQLLVADACSGLNSMVSLTAVGTLFMYVVGRKSKIHNAVMLASILPIAFLSNIVRVLALVLVTIHLGDEAGQGFLHGMAGIVLMLVALVMFFVLDVALSALFAEQPVEARAAAVDPGVETDLR